MSIESIYQIGAAAMQPVADASAAPAQARTFEVAQFAQAWNQAGAAPNAQPAQNVAGDAATANAVQQAQPSEGFRAVVAALNNLNGKATTIEEVAAQFGSGAAEMTPSDMLNLTVRCHEFLFQCELTSNVANRSSDGVQQLFRQQS